MYSPSMSGLLLLLFPSQSLFQKRLHQSPKELAEYRHGKGKGHGPCNRARVDGLWNDGGQMMLQKVSG